MIHCGTPPYVIQKKVFRHRPLQKYTLFRVVQVENIKKEINYTQTGFTMQASVTIQIFLNIFILKNIGYCATTPQCL